MNRLRIVLVCLLSFFSFQPQAFAESSDALCAPPSEDIDPILYQQFLAELGEQEREIACGPLSACVKACMLTGFGIWLYENGCYALKSMKCAGIDDPDQREACEFEAERACNHGGALRFTGACLLLCLWSPIFERPR